jgi:hypothetical protein
MLPHPAGLLEGAGKRMRHVKLRPGTRLDEEALSDMIVAAYHDIRRRLDLENVPMKKNTKVAARDAKSGNASSAARIKVLNDWRSETLARVRELIKQADPGVVEQVKWRKPSNAMRGVPVWEHDGIICTGETYKAVVKLTFAKGASLDDPSRLFNASLEGNVRRAIDIREGDKIDEKAFKALIRAAVALNTSAPSKAGASRARKKPKKD